MTSKRKIEAIGNLVLLHGDEMAQVAFDEIIKRFIKKRVEMTLHELDLSAENRVRTNGQVVTEAIEALLAYGIGIKNAGITVNKKQLEALVDKLQKEGHNIAKDSLNKLATKSPNGTIRKGIGGNITREDIPFNNLRRNIPDWKNRDIDVVTMMTGGLIDSFNRICQFSGILKLTFINDKGHSEVLHSRTIKKDDIYLLATNDIAKVKLWAVDFFQRALDEKRDAYVGLKDTVMPGYDGVMKDAVEDIFREKFEKKFKAKGLKYYYGLIDAQAAQIVVSPPEKPSLWGIPDNTSGRKMWKLVNDLKVFGIPQRQHQVAISRMSAGGGDQYGSFNAPAGSNGILTLSIGQRVLHSRDVKKGDPIMLMSNHPADIRAWVEQSFADAAKKDQEIYFGLKREYMQYDTKFSDIINEVRDELSEGGKTPPPIMVMTPSKQLCKMICDPPRNALYGALNLDGDIFSDITAALGGSLATASSIIASPNGTMLFEAPHGTAPDLYRQYIESKGKKSFFNPSALLYAAANALEIISERELNKDLKKYSDDIKKALIMTVDQGIVTPDLKGKTTEPKKEKLKDLSGFLDAVEKNLDKIRA